MKRKITQIFKEFVKIIKLPEMKVLPGQLAFYILMSFIPILVLCFLVASSLVKNYDFLNQLSHLLPKGILNVLWPLLTTESYSINIILVIFGYLIIASNGPASIIITSNELYKIDNNNALKLRVKAFIMTIVIIILFLFVLFIPLLGDLIVKFVFKLIGSPNYLYNYLWIYKVLKVLVSFIFIYLGIKLLYVLAPDKKIESNTTTYGSLFTTLGWIIATEVFSFYITKIAKYDLLYGNFANVLILLIWVNLLAYLFVVGMAINLNNYKFANLE